MFSICQKISWDFILSRDFLDMKFHPDLDSLKGPLAKSRPRCALMLIFPNEIMTVLEVQKHPEGCLFLAKCLPLAVQVSGFLRHKELKVWRPKLWVRLPECRSQLISTTVFGPWAQNKYDLMLPFTVGCISSKDIYMAVTLGTVWCKNAPS